jgi:hypothetical protein
MMLLRRSGSVRRFAEDAGNAFGGQTGKLLRTLRRQAHIFVTRVDDDRSLPFFGFKERLGESAPWIIPPFVEKLPVEDFAFAGKDVIGPLEGIVWYGRVPG